MLQVFLIAKLFPMVENFMQLFLPAVNIFILFPVPPLLVFCAEQKMSTNCAVLVLDQALCNSGE